MLDSLKDPNTGKLKPAVIIGAGGVAAVGMFLILGKNSGGGSSSGSQAGGTPGMVSGGQSGDNTAALGELQDAILALGDQIGAHSNIPPAQPTVPAVTPTPTPTPATPTPVAPSPVAKVLQTYHLSITGRTPLYSASGRVVKYISSGSISANKVNLAGVTNQIDPSVKTGYFQILSGSYKGLYIKTPVGSTAESAVAGHYSYH
jgi:hypothetical protein